MRPQNRHTQRDGEHYLDSRVGDLFLGVSIVAASQEHCDVVAQETEQQGDEHDG